MGILQSDERGQITAFHEKPQSDDELDQLQLAEPPGENPEELYLASMGLYLFEPQVLVSLLMGSDEDDFGKHIISDAIHKVGVFAHTFEGYWEDIGTIRSFYDANLALTESEPPFDFYRADAPVYTPALPGRDPAGKMLGRARDYMRRLVDRLCQHRALGDRYSLGHRRGLPDRRYHRHGCRFRRNGG